MAALGKMELVLTANQAAFMSQMEKATKALDKFAADGKKTHAAIQKAAASMGAGFGVLKGAILAAAGAFVSGRLIGSLTSAAEEVDKLGKASKRLGIDAKSLSALKFAADEAGIEFETLAKMAGKAGKSVAAIVAGGGSSVGIGGLNVQLLDAAGKMRSIDELLPDIAAGLESVGSEGEQLRLADKFFGKAGGEAFVQLLKESGTFVENLATQTERAKRLGVIFDDDQVEKLTAYNDAVGRISQAWLGLRVQVMTKVAPALTEMANKAASTLAAVPEMVTNVMKVFDSGPAGKAARLSLELIGRLIKRTLYDAIVLGGQYAIDTLATYVTARLSLAFEDLKPFGYKSDKTMAERLQEKIGEIDPEYGKRWDMYVANLTENVKFLGIALDNLTGASKLIEQHGMNNIITDPKKTKDATAAVSELSKEVKDFSEQASKGIFGFASNLSDAFTEATFGAKLSFAEIATSFGKMLESMALKTLVFEPILRQVGIGFSAFLESSFDPGTTNGGNTQGGYGVSDVAEPQARGGVWNAGRLMAFAAGGVVGAPTFFPMANGGTGLMGEKGKEAIMPLAETSAGLGVHGIPSEITVNIYDQRQSGERPQVTQTTGPDGRKQLSVLIRDEMKGAISDGSLDRVMSSGYGLSRRGTRN